MGSIPTEDTKKEIQMKRCCTCKHSKELFEFNKNQDRCRECSKIWYRNNSVVHKKNVTKSRKERVAFNRAIIRSLKDFPCVDCGIKYPYYVMDFDHKRGIKLAHLSSLAANSIEKILEEIAKCDLVCANCHRIRTYGPVA